MGKSRLLETFRRRLRAQVHLYVQGRCLSYGDGVAFRALAEMVRQRLSIAEEDPAEAAAARLAKRAANA